MTYSQTVRIKNGKEIRIRNAEGSDGSAVLEIFNLTHGETDYLLSYPDENRFDAARESQFLARKSESENEVELLAIVDGRIVGNAGIDAVGTPYKIRHRAEFGISILKEYWGLGIGRALTEACIACARSAGYLQLELNVVADNAGALALYRKMGFTEYARNPLGFRSRTAGFQELISMRLVL